MFVGHTVSGQVIDQGPDRRQEAAARRKYGVDIDIGGGPPRQDRFELSVRQVLLDHEVRHLGNANPRQRGHAKRREVITQQARVRG